MLGKKRNFDEKRKILPPPNDIKNHSHSSSNINISNQKSFEKLKVAKEINILYNMKRSLYLSCVHTKHAKYPNNKIIPCLSFSSSKH